MEARWLTIKEASEYLGFAKATLYCWVSREKIPFTRRGQRIRFDRLALDKWMQQSEPINRREGE